MGCLSVALDLPLLEKLCYFPQSELEGESLFCLGTDRAGRTLCDLPYKRVEVKFPACWVRCLTKSSSYRHPSSSCLAVCLYLVF